MHSLPLIGWRSSDARLHYLYASVTEFTLNPYLHTTNTKNFFFPPSQPPNEFKPTNILTEPNTVFEPWSISPTTDSWTSCMTPPSPLTRNNTNHHQPPALHLSTTASWNRNARKIAMPGAKNRKENGRTILTQQLFLMTKLPWWIKRGGHLWSVTRVAAKDTRSCQARSRHGEHWIAIQQNNRTLSSNKCLVATQELLVAMTSYYW